MNFVTRTVPYIFSTRDYFNSSIQGNGIYYGLPMWLILLLRIVFAVLAVVSLWLLYRYYRHPRSAVLDVDVLGRAADRVVPGAVAGAGLLLDDVVPVPDDGGAAQLGDPQLAGVAGDLRVHDDGPLAALALADDGPLPRVHEDHLRLVADADRGVLRAVLPLSRRQGRGPPRRRHRSAVPPPHPPPNGGARSSPPRSSRSCARPAPSGPFTGEYTDTKTEGIYECRACGAELFRSSEKFESHCGWPSFFDPANSDAVILRSDDSMGMRASR